MRTYLLIYKLSLCARDDAPALMGIVEAPLCVAPYFVKITIQNYNNKNFLALFAYF